MTGKLFNEISPGGRYPVPCLTNMEYVLTKFRIKKGKLTLFRELLEKTHEDRKAFEDGLVECGVSMECQFVESSADGDFFYVFKKVASNEQLKKTIKSSPTEIHEMVRRIHTECLEPRLDLNSIINADLG